MLLFTQMADGRIIKTEFVLQPEEFAKASRLSLGSLPMRVRWPAWLQCGLLAALVLIVPLSLPRESPLPFMSLMIFFLVIGAGVLFRQAFVRYTFAPMAGKNIWYEFGDSGFTCGMPGAESRVEWPSNMRYKGTDTLFVMLKAGHFYTIPKRALSDEQLVQLRELLTEKAATQ